MEEIINLIGKYGVEVICVAYMIYFQNSTMKEMLNTLNTMNSRLMIIEEKIK